MCAGAVAVEENGTDIRYIQKLLGHAKLETTTIYTKVAILRQRSVQSPLDTNLGQAQRNHPRQKSCVGRLQISLEPQPDKTAKATVTILTSTRSVRLQGIVVKEPRQGWLVLDIPPLEAWSEALRWVTKPQRERIESPEFYELLQREIGRRFLTGG